MTNPFKKIAVALLLRGTLFALLGLVLLARTVPSLLDTTRDLSISGAVIGALLLLFGSVDMIHGVKRMTRIRKEKLESPAINYAYGAGNALPANLMNADENPNETALAPLIEWLARVIPKLAYLPFPYTGALHSVLVAFGLGVAGLLIYILLRVIMAGTMNPEQLASMLDWYLWFYFVIGFGFWAAVSRFGFRRALLFASNLLPVKIVLLFLALLIGAVLLAGAQAKSGQIVTAPPDLGALTAILWVGSLVVIGSAMAIVWLRARRSPESYSVHRSEEFFTVGMHPTDIINVIKSFTGKLGPGAYVHLGSWKPVFKEHTAVSAGEFEANLNAESTIQLTAPSGQRPEAALGTLLALLGIAMLTIAGFMAYNFAGTSWDTPAAAVATIRLPVALSIFGFLLYRLGVIPIAELEWTSIITACHLEGTFQTRGGVALMQAGDNGLKGSVLTSATVQPRCAYLVSVGFLQAGLAKNNVVRLIDRVEPATQIASDLLVTIRQQAEHMLNAGAPIAPPEPTVHALPDSTSAIEDESGDAT